MAKAHLEDADGCQAIGHDVRNSNNTLHREIANDDNVISIDARARTWDKSIKDCARNSNHNSSGCRLSCFEPVALRFNLNNALNDFWFFSNHHEKRHNKNNSEGFTLDTN